MPNLTWTQRRDFTSSIRVAEFMDTRGEWNLGLLSETMRDETVNKIVALHPPSQQHLDDNLAWLGSKDVNFSVASTYSFIVGHLDFLHCSRVANLWKWKGPYKIIILV
ncbi:hypothetical protein TanjilG_09387 [Lupinus angustifolius]|uniref:Uncharacterized protein n=1 Tax=Lupinus angustifolius TaxID=3871 RepID=A0A1J7HMC2_LUPAN|nr:hypothetical protein TanjilG_09387 [Lupinus angustifolius]